MIVFNKELLESASDYVGFVGACVGLAPAVRSVWVYVKARHIIKEYKKQPPAVTRLQFKIAKQAAGKASHFSRLDVAGVGGGFALLVISFLLKIISKHI